MRAQLILYDQCNQAYCDPSAEGIFFICSTGTPRSPIGPLYFHPSSRITEYAIGKHFCDEQRSKGKKSDMIIARSYLEGMLKLSHIYQITEWLVMTPSEQYIHTKMTHIQQKLASSGIRLIFLPNTQFLLSQEEFAKHYEKPPIMEFFYRMMRKKYNILMDGDKPVGGKRNFDKDNRKFDRHHQARQNATIYDDTYIQEAKMFWQSRYQQQKLPAPYHYENLNDIKIYTPVTRSQALTMLNHFVSDYATMFGPLEDAIYQNDPFVYHSRLSHAINSGLLLPQEVVKTIANANIPLTSKEGFIRQIIGRREYMYHFFHHYKHDIYKHNFFGHTQELPAYFWGKEQKKSNLNCVDTTIERVEEFAYSHHITRLMIIGNYTLLKGYHPHHILRWFWEQYIDAYERVVVPNVLSMSQYTDGGRLATKPYIASANYINKMSNLCKHCRYDPKQKEGPNACPLNGLFRTFLEKHESVFAGTRLSMLIKSYQNKKSNGQKQLNN